MSWVIWLYHGTYMAPHQASRHSVTASPTCRDVGLKRSKRNSAYQVRRADHSAVRILEKDPWALGRMVAAVGGDHVDSLDRYSVC